MSLQAAARSALSALERAGVADARFEAELLARHAARIDREHYFRAEIHDPRALKRFACAIDRRVRREPAAYITRSREFFGLSLRVSHDVLIPRPETELLVEAVLAAIPDEPSPSVVDVGTGSGAVAVAVAVHAPGAMVVATDCSLPALRVARKNARAHGAHISFMRTDLAAAVGVADIVVANLPYIPAEDIASLEPEVRDWEPRLALDGGADGLDLVRRLIRDCGGRLRPRLLALEVGFGQAERVAGLCRLAGAEADVRPDLAGIPRAVLASWR